MSDSSGFNDPSDKNGDIHIVARGEYLSQIAKNYGIPPQKIWDDPANQELRQKRKTPNILFPGDSLFIPRKIAKEQSCATDQRHRFKSTVGKQKIRLILKDGFGKPIRVMEYRLSIPGLPEVKGKTDSTGLLEAKIPVDLQTVTLLVPSLGYCVTLNVGQLDPAARLSGIQQRLDNLGFYCGSCDGILGPLTQSALRRFQTWAGLPVSGKADDQTRHKLEELHDGVKRGAQREDEEGDSRKLRKVNEEESMASDESSPQNQNASGEPGGFNPLLGE